MAWLNPGNWGLVQGVRDTAGQLDALYKQYLIMDQEATVPLKEALASVRALMDHHVKTGSLDGEEGLIEETIRSLSVIIASETPQRIFPSPALEEAAAREHAQGIQRRCQPLAQNLRDFISVGLVKPEVPVIARQLQEVYETLDIEKRKQVGPIARGMDAIIKRVHEEYQKATGQAEQAAEARRSASNQHPLLKLLGLLGSYENHAAFLEDRRQIDLYNALFELNNYGTHFEGILEHVLEEGRLPASNPAIFKKISNFLRKKIHHGAVQTREQMRPLHMAVYNRAALLEDIVPQGVQDGGDGGKRAWAKEYIKGEIAEDGQLAECVRIAREETKFRQLALFTCRYRQLKLTQSEPQQKALKLHIFALAFPAENGVVEETRLQRAQRVINGNDAPTVDSPALRHAIAQMTLHNLENEEDRIRFGASVIPLNAEAVGGDWPSTPSEKGLAEAMWLAVAHFEDLQKCEELHQQLRGAQECRITDLPTQLDILISILEKEPQLLEDGGERMLAELSQIILGWVNLAVREMKNYRNADETEIDRKFEKVTQLIAKGKYLDGIRLAQRLIEESPVGLRMWREEQVASPKDLFSATLEDFRTVSAPIKPPKSQAEVKRKLGIAEEAPVGDWDAAWETVIEKERHKLVRNSCDFTAFNVALRYVMGFSAEERESVYKKLLESLEAVAGRNRNYNGPDLRERVKQAIASVCKKFPHEITDESVEKILIALDEVRNAGYDAERTAKELHETLYFSLLWEVIDHANPNSIIPSSVMKLAGHGLLVIMHKLLEFFIRPFAESLLQAIQRDVILPTNGALTETHLNPIKSLGKALDSYTSAKKAWSELKSDQAKGHVTALAERTLIGKDEQEAMEIILDNPAYYHGYDPREIDLEVGYLAVDHFLQVTDFSKTTEAWHELISYNAQRPLIASPSTPLEEWINTIGGLMMRVISIIPHAVIYTLHFCLKVVETLINFLAKQLAKFAIWKWDIVTNLLEEMTKSLFKESYHTPVLDELVLDQLKELERQILQDSQEERGGMLEHESPLIKRQIREAFANLFEAIEIDSKDTSQEVDDHGLNPTTKWAKIQLKSNLKELLTSLLVVSSQSFLHKEQMHELLLKVLTTANDGLRGKTTMLKPEELQALREELGREPSAGEIERRARHIHGRLQGEIEGRLNNILENGVNPVISRTIDQGLKGPSDMLLDYIAWMERRLFSYPGRGLASERNIIHMLREDLEGFNGKNPTEQDDVLRKIHGDYTTFIQEFIAKQSNIDQERIPNDLKLNLFIRTDLHPILEELTPELMHFIGRREGRPEAIVRIQALLKRLEDKLIEKRESFNKIKRAEQSRVEGMRKGFGGFVQAAVDVGKGLVHDQVTPYAQRILNGQIRGLADKSRGLYQNPVLVKHIIRYQMLGWVEGRA